MKEYIVGFLFSALVIFSLTADICAKEPAQKKTALQSKEPIQVVSDRLEAFDEQKLVVFSGNAVAVQGDKVIKADSLSLYYKKDKNAAKGKGKSDIAAGGDLERIEARGHVSVTQGPKVATGELAIYYQDAQKIILTGNPVMKEGSNSITGDKITVLLDENRGIVERSGNKRVTAIIYPKEDQDAGKKKDKKK
jgi:lipopolysaccharide export system protein LptA